MWRWHWNRTCTICGQPIPGFHPNGRKVRRDVKTCSAACEKALQRQFERHNADHSGAA